ncbi:MAG: hypothetical protein C0485_17830 [Pirellula sp.]|nr:hypothetical protein [Pirellula sp.]
MRARRLAIAVSCCALTCGCSDQSVERPASAAAVQKKIVASPVVVKTPKRAATSEVATGLDFSATADGPLDVNSLNPVKMSTNTTTGSRFNPFAK